MKQLYFFVILLAYGCSLQRDGAASSAAGSFDAGQHTGGADGDSDGGLSDGTDDPRDGTGGGGDGINGDGTDGIPGDGTDQPGDGSDDAGSNVMPSPDAGMPVPDAGQPEPDAGTPGFTPAPGEVGAPCENNNECSGLNNPQCLDKLEDVDIPNGYCTHRCVTTGLGCGSNERCVQNLCARTCTTNADCRAPEGFRCLEGLCLIPDD